MPYVAVGVALMCYNYARFEDPFEFGQAYQLTVADQHLYSITFDAKTIVRIINDSAKHIYAVASILGSSVYYVMSVCFGLVVWGTVVSVLITIVIRLLAAHFRWSLPRANDFMEEE